MSDPSIHPLPAPSGGAADHMVYLYDAQTDGPVLSTVVPIHTSDQATEAGRTLVANGLEFVDLPSAPLLAGPGLPTASDGVEGAFWLDRSTSLVHGPKGAQTAGQWPVGARRALPVQDGLYALDAPLALGTQGMHANPGVTALKFTSFAAPATQPGGGFVGLELVVGSDESLQGGLGWVALRPQGSHPSSRKHLRLGGHQQGEVQDLQGRRFLVTSDLPTEYLRGTPKTVSLQGTNTSAYVTLESQAVQGAWSDQAQGWTVPLAGEYRLSAQITMEHTSGSGPAEVSVRWHVDGAIPNDPAVVQKIWLHGDRPGSVALTTRLPLDAGQVAGVHLQMDNGSARLLAGLGQILIERVA